MLFDAVIRRWSNLLEAMPDRLAAVRRWTDPVDAPSDTATGHQHTVPTLVCCLAGVMRIERPGTRVDLLPGEALVIAPGVWHHHAQVRPGSVVFGQGFMAAWSDVVVYDGRRDIAGRIPTQPSRLLMDRLLGEADDARRLAMTRELMQQALGETARPLEFPHPALPKMLRLLWGRLHRGVTADDLVRVSGLARSQAYAIFTTGYGISPRLAIARSRLDLAEALLNAGVPAAQVAARCGFPDRTTFTRAWKRAGRLIASPR